MSTVDEIELAIKRLPREEFWKLAKWFDDTRSEEWDREIGDDVASGRLAQLLKEADQDYDAGKCHPL